MKSKTRQDRFNCNPYFNLSAATFFFVSPKGQPFFVPSFCVVCLWNWPCQSNPFPFTTCCCCCCGWRKRTKCQMQSQHSRPKKKRVLSIIKHSPGPLLHSLPRPGPKALKPVWNFDEDPSIHPASSSLSSRSFRSNLFPACLKTVNALEPCSGKFFPRILIHCKMQIFLPHLPQLFGPRKAKQKCGKARRQSPPLLGSCSMYHPSLSLWNWKNERKQGRFPLFGTLPLVGWTNYKSWNIIRGFHGLPKSLHPGTWRDWKMFPNFWSPQVKSQNFPIAIESRGCVAVVKTDDFFFVVKNWLNNFFPQSFVEFLTLRWSQPKWSEKRTGWF